MATLTIVIAAYNEQAALPVMHPRLAGVLDGLDLDCRVLYVDDGSRDGTWAALQAIAAADPRVSLLRLARNFGKELALTAGLDQVHSDAAIVLDADGQDPPELVPAFVAKWREGYDVVYGTRSRREGETWFKKFTAAGFYRVMRWLSQTDIPRDTGDFRLMSGRVLDALRQLRERQRFMKGLFTWVGFRQVSLPYERQARMAGATKFNYWRLWNLALEGITSFSTVPLRLATYVGVFTALGAFAWGLWIIARTVLWGDPVEGWPSLMTVVLFLGGVQLVALGIIGEYLGRLYVEAKQRPLYLISETAGAAPVKGTSCGRDFSPDAPGQAIGTEVPPTRAKRSGLKSLPQGPLPSGRFRGRRSGFMIKRCSTEAGAMRNVNQILEGKGGRVVAVPQEAPVLEVIRLMAEHHIGSVLVMRGSELLGIATERDYARKVILQGRSSSDTPVGQIMSSPVVSVLPTDTAQTCMELMTARKIRHLPVLEEGRVLGMISIGDLVKAVIEDQQHEIAQLQQYIAS